jgi:hypothetical protein
MSKEKATRSYSWAVTWWDENPIVFNPDTMKYLLYAPEVCPKTGKDHWQTYIVWRFQKTMTASLKNLEYVKHPHHEQCLGSYESNLNYIKGPYVSPDKSKTKPYNPDWKEFGQVPSKGQRTDLIELKDSMAKGDITVDEILMTKPDIFHLYGRTLFALEDALLRKKHRTWMTQCDWFYGPTGVGKSHHAFAGYDEKTHYIWTHDKGWWDGYNGQAIVIMNDFRGKIEYNELLQLIDKWPHKVSRRGREPTQFRAQKIIITSSLHPSEVYNKRNVEDSLDQLYRRIKLHKLSNENDDFIVDNIYSDDD